MFASNDNLAILIVAAAALALAWRAYRALVSPPAHGCGSKCSSCPTTSPNKRPLATLLSIEPATHRHDANP